MFQISRREYDHHRIFGESRRKPAGTAHPIRVIIFPVVAAVAGLFFVVAVALRASASWMLLKLDQEVNTELNRWFLTVAGSVDAITAGVLLALAYRPRRTLVAGDLPGLDR